MFRHTLPRAPQRALWLAAVLVLVALTAATCGRSRSEQTTAAGDAAVAAQPAPSAVAETGATETVETPEAVKTVKTVEAVEAAKGADQPEPPAPARGHAFPTATPTLPAASDTAQNAAARSPFAAARPGLIAHLAVGTTATPTGVLTAAPAAPTRKPASAIPARQPENGALAVVPAAPAAPALREVAARSIPPTPTALPAAVPDRLVLPALKLDTPVVELGWNTQTSRAGDLFSEWEVAEYAAGWHKNSALPGQGGNVVFSGHNNILGAVFRELDRLQRGDTAQLYVGDKVYEYAIDKVMIVPEKHATDEQRQANAAWIGPTDEERLTLVSCWPRDDNTHRIIVVAHPVSVTSKGR